jgi:CubicO group peptidase (beta-lactamase class C family)
MKVIALAALALVAAGSCASASAAPRCEQPAALRSEIETRLQGMIDEHGFAGFAYAVARREGIVVSGGVGVARRRTDEPASGRTIYQIGSITKTFTGLLLARLAAEDRLDLGDALSEHLSDVAAAPRDPGGRVPTLQAVATHTAGLPRYPSNLDRVDGDPMRGFTREQLYTGLRAVRLETPLPLPLSYSNFGYGVLAEAMTNATGEPFERLLHAQVIAPLALPDTAFSLTPEQRARLATPYRDDDVTVESEPWNMGAMAAAGGLYSTAEDLARFASWQLGGMAGALGEREQEARSLQRAPLFRYGGSSNWAYGLGVFVVDDLVAGVDVIWHGGDVDGYAGSFVLLPDQDLALVYLTNVGFGHGFEAFQNSMITRMFELCGPS